MPDAATRESLLALADQCVRCGVCLPHCPTYSLDRREAESPRGRIALIGALADGRLAPEATTLQALDHCLACGRCEQVCPAHVPYTTLLTQARTQGWHGPSSGKARVLQRLAAHPRLLAWLLRLGTRLRPWLPPRWRRRWPTRATAPPLDPPPATGAAPDATATLFLGCVARAFDHDLHRAATHLLRAAGLRVIETRGQSCCGALAHHAGDAIAATRLADRNRSAFAAAGADHVVTSATGCHGSVQRACAPAGLDTRDLLDLLGTRAARLRFRAVDGTVALHRPCTQQAMPDSLRGLRALHARVPGLRIVDLPAGCCGAAGAHVLNCPDRADALRAPALDAIRASGARVVLSSNIGCRLHLQAGLDDIPVLHPALWLATLLDPTP